MNSKLLLGLACVLIIITACTNVPNSKNQSLTGGIKKISSSGELRDFLKQSQELQGYGNAVLLSPLSSRQEGIASKGMLAAPGINSQGGAEDYSSTNIQVAGVDEADFVKNDNKYIYALAGDKLVIVDAYPARDAKTLSETKIKGSPSQLFVAGTRLVVFTQTWDERVTISPYDFVPRPRSTRFTHAIVYDITDKKAPKELYDYSVKGSYFQSRMIGDWVYFIVKENAYYNPIYIGMPVIKEGTATLIKPDIYYFDNPESSYNFHTIVALNLQKGKESVNAKSFLLGYSNNLYVSNDNIYITYQKMPPYSYYKTHNQERFFKVVLPLLPSNTREKIEAIKGNNELNSAEKWGKISAILEEMYNSMSEGDKEHIVNEIQQAVEKYESKLEAERRKTVIQKIAIDKGSINFVAKGEVPGYLLNQFSMDEHKGYLRVATNVYLWHSRGPEMFNNVYVLDDKLNIVGRIEGIAEGERIYSTRFIGDRLYMVTFKRIDPLFVIDMSDPTNPEVLGKLKMPGYSDYLHPYDKNHLIGIGKETQGNEWGGVSVGGVKLALFDVSDVEHPSLIGKYEIGEAGSDSGVLRDHKAFLFDKDKNLLVIPVRVVLGRHYYEDGYWKQNTWQGAYVFRVDPEQGFVLKGRVGHHEEQSSRWWSSPYDVKRALYMDDVLYTISSKLIKMNALDNISDELGSISLPSNYESPMPLVAHTKI